VGLPDVLQENPTDQSPGLDAYPDVPVFPVDGIVGGNVTDSPYNSTLLTGVARSGPIAWSGVTTIRLASQTSCMWTTPGAWYGSYNVYDQLWQ
jgi:hypothetical protein